MACQGPPDTCDTYGTCPSDDGGLANADAGLDGTVHGDGQVADMDGQVDAPGDGATGIGEDGGQDAQLDGGQVDATASCGPDAGMAYCGGDAGCVDTTSSAENCASCGHACTGPANSILTCAASVCGFVCATGYHLCSGQCLSDADDPSVDPCLATDAFGVFVVSGGTGTGTQASPLGSIPAAMALAKSSGKGRVFVCTSGAFTQPVTVGASDDGVNVYGGFTSCPTSGAWAWTSGALSKVTPASAGPVLSISGLTTGVTFEDMEFTAESATAPGGSSIAAFVASSPVTFVGSTINAGNGLTGSNGGTFTNWSGASPGGGTATSAQGADGGVNPCLDTTTSSAGGTGAIPNGATATDGTAIPALGSPNGGSSASASCTDGTAGANAQAVGLPDAGAGAPSTGIVTTTGWAPLHGGDADDGDPGQGGGGGGARGVITTLGGGGGGSGGCGGGRGLGGQTGGSSFALLSFNSMVTVTKSILSSANAGNGGNGGPGQQGQSGGGTGAGICNGGVGGIGSGGGGGGGGAGGISASLYWSGGIPPMINGSSVSSTATLTGFTFGIAGNKGAKGSGASANGTGAPGKDGTDGATPPSSAAVIEAP